MGPQLQKQINSKFIRDTLLKVQQGTYPTPPRVPHFRVSSLPFCPLIFALNIKNYNPDKHEDVDFKSGFYFEQGHAIHSLWQKTSANMAPTHIVGDWQCNHILRTKTQDDKNTITRCNRLLRFCTAQEMQKAKCPHGNRDCLGSQIYAELEFDWFGLEGHSDLLLREKINKEKRYHVIDWKTTGLFLFDKPKIALKMGYYPNLKYIEQIETYCVLLELKYKIKIYSYTIAYVSRDRAVHTDKKPALHLFTYRFTDAARSNRMAKMKVYRSRFKIAQKTLATPTKRNIKKLYESRPCHTPAQYANNMAHGFFDRCEHAGTDPYKSCFNGTMLKHLNKELR